MSETIKDGNTGNTLKVDQKNRAHTFSVVETENRFVNSKEGKAWSATFDVTPTGANDYFWYLKNTGANNLHVTDIRIASTVITRINYHVVSGAPTFSGSDDTVFIQKNLGSSREPSVDSQFDVDITTLTDEGTLFFEMCAVVNTRYNLSTSSNIIIPQGQAIAFERIAATGAITCTVSIVEIDPADTE